MDKRTFKKYRRETLQTWLSYKNQESYYTYLDLLNKLVSSIFKQETTVNTCDLITKEVKSKLKEDKQKLFTDLIHSITLLNHTYRVFNSKGYESTQEDVLSAAALLQLAINPASLLHLKSKLIYWELQKEFGIETFTTLQVVYLLGIPKSTTSRHIRYLQNANYIRHIKTGIRNTHYYQLA